MGAPTPTMDGNFFAWGETESKAKYSDNNYKYYDYKLKEYIDIGGDISGTDYDVAHVLWKGDWRMPKHDDFYYLKYNCEKEWVEINGKKGVKFTGTNGNAIFMPASGDKLGVILNNNGSEGHYWTSQLKDMDEAKYFYFDSNLQMKNANYYKYIGFTVRPVIF